MGYGYLFGFKYGEGKFKVVGALLSRWFPRSPLNNSVQVVNMDTLISGKVRSYLEY